MTILVVDASVVVKWVVAEPDSDKALLVRRGNNLIAPELMIAEVANILATKMRLGEFDLSEAEEAAGFIAAAGIEFAPMLGLLEGTIRLADRLRHPAYDCTYLALALSIGARFITADERFQRRLAASGDQRLIGACLSLSAWPDEG